jgi:hypothetical protein
MNANEMLIHGFAATLNQIVATAVAEAVKPLEERIVTLQAAYTDWKAMEHVAAKAVQPLQDRVIALEINQTLVSSAKVNLADLVAELVDGHDFVKSIDAAISNYDFSSIIDWDNKIEEGIENYDFSDIMRENLPDMVDEDRVQEMIDETIDACTIRRG